MEQYGENTIVEVEELMREEDEVIWGREIIFKYDDNYFNMAHATRA